MGSLLRRLHGLGEADFPDLCLFFECLRGLWRKTGVVGGILRCGGGGLSGT